MTNFCIIFNFLLQLSHYLDTVEVKISQQVSSKSEEFFHNMKSHDTLMEQIRQSIELTQNLRYEHIFRL